MLCGACLHPPVMSCLINASGGKVILVDYIRYTENCFGGQSSSGHRSKQATRSKSAAVSDIVF